MMKMNVFREKATMVDTIEENDLKDTLLIGI